MGNTLLNGIAQENSRQYRYSISYYDKTTAKILPCLLISRYYSDPYYRWLLFYSLKSHQFFISLCFILSNSSSVSNWPIVILLILHSLKMFFESKTWSKPEFWKSRWTKESRTLEPVLSLFCLEFFCSIVQMLRDLLRTLLDWIGLKEKWLAQ